MPHATTHSRPILHLSGFESGPHIGPLTNCERKLLPGSVNACGHKLSEGPKHQWMVVAPADSWGSYSPHHDHLTTASPTRVSRAERAPFFGHHKSGVWRLCSLPRILRLVPRVGTYRPHKVWQYGRPSHAPSAFVRRTVSPISASVARGLNGACSHSPPPDSPCGCVCRNRRRSPTGQAWAECRTTLPPVPRWRVPGSA